MAFLTMNCAHGHYAGACESNLCECDCHKPVASPAQALYDKELKESKEAAHQAVKAFDLKPNDITALEAVYALSLFVNITRLGRPVSHDERRSFEKRWDAKVEEGKTNG